MNRINIDERILAAAIRYSLPRETGMIDICVDELNKNKSLIQDWMLQRIAEDTRDYLRWEHASGEEDAINTDYAHQIIRICNNELEERKCLTGMN